LRGLAAGKADFADWLIERSAEAAGREQTMTFNLKASQHALMTLIAQEAYCASLPSSLRATPKKSSPD